MVGIVKMVEMVSLTLHFASKKELERELENWRVQGCQDWGRIGIMMRCSCCQTYHKSTKSTNLQQFLSHKSSRSSHLPKTISKVPHLKIKMTVQCRSPATAHDNSVKISLAPLARLAILNGQSATLYLRTCLGKSFDLSKF